MDLGMNDTLNWGYMHCMIAASREMSDEPNGFILIQYLYAALLTFGKEGKEFCRAVPYFKILRHDSFGY